MNKRYFLLLLALFGPAAQLMAQTGDPTRATLDNLFAPLDKSQVPTGLLADSANHYYPQAAPEPG